MVDVFRIEAKQFPDSERRVKKYILIWCSAGGLGIEIDSVNFRLCKGEVITITSGQYHRLYDAGNAKGMLLEFTYDFFCKDDNDIELMFQNGLFCHFDRNEITDVSGHPAIGMHLNLIEKELLETPYQYMISMHSRIELILVELNRAKIFQGYEIWKPTALFLRFLELIRADFNHNLPVKFYAEKLSTTETKLNELSKLHAGKTAQQIIHGLIASEAGRLLFYEKLTVKETAYALGFTDPFYFSNFFKKHTKLAPQAFKEQLKS